MDNLEKYNSADAVTVAPEGLVGWVLDLEAQADDLTAKAREINARAGEIRLMILNKLKKANLTSATHESGYRATIRTTETVKLEDPDTAMKSLKKNKLDLFITKVPKQVIVAHEEINFDQLKTWIKDGTPAQKELIAGVKVEAKESLVIAKK